jgi:hypothetical protein
MARCAAPQRTIALLKERLVLGASRLHVGRHRGGYRGKPYEGNPANPRAGSTQRV